MSPARRKKYPTAAELAREFVMREFPNEVYSYRRRIRDSITRLLRRYALLVPQVCDAWNEMRKRVEKSDVLLSDCAEMLAAHYSDADTAGASPALKMERRIRDYLEGR